MNLFNINQNSLYRVKEVIKISKSDKKLENVHIAFYTLTFNLIMGGLRNFVRCVVQTSSFSLF